MSRLASFFIKQKKVIFYVTLLFLSALVLRLYHLNELSVFADEAIYVRWAQVMRAEPTLRFLPLSDGKQPFYMWVLMFVLPIFKDPLIAGRVLSLVFGMLTFVGIGMASFILTKSKDVIILSLLLYAISPFSLFFDRMALTDSALSMFGIWTFVLAVKTTKLRRWDLAMCTGFALGGALLTKSPALFFVLLLPTVLILEKYPKDKIKTVKKILSYFPYTLCSLFIAFVMYNFLRLGPNFHLLKSRNLDYVYPYSHIFSSLFDPFFAHLGGVYDYFVRLGPYPLLILLFIGLIFGLIKYKKQTLLLGFWAFIPVVVQAEYAKVMTARYIFFTLPFIFILASLSLLTKGFAKKAVYLIIFIFVMTSLSFNRNLLFDIYGANLPQGERSGYLEEWTAGVGIRNVADYIINIHQKNTKTNIIVGTEGYFGTLPDGLQIYLNNVNNVTVIGVGLGFDKLPESLIQSREAGNETFLLINSTRLLLKKNELEKLELVKSYPKGVRKTGSREYNLYGPQESLLFFRLK